MTPIDRVKKSFIEFINHYNNLLEYIEMIVVSRDLSIEEKKKITETREFIEKKCMKQMV